MPSLKSYIVNWVIWYRFKGSWQSAEGLNRRIEESRKVQDYRPPRHITDSVNVEESNFGNVPIYRVSPKAPETPTTARLLYLHGGGFVFEMTPEHWGFVAKLAERLHAVVTVAIYPLGPETPLLKMYEAIQPLYNDMAASPDPTPFWAMGDSAGGTMTLVLTQEAINANLPTASRIVPITPCVDATLKNPDLHAAAKHDYWLDAPGIAEATRLICPDVAAEDPRISPIHGVVDKLPPMLLLAGTRDLLTPDSKLFVDKCKSSGRDAEFFLGQGMLHVWPLLPIWEAEEALVKITSWLQTTP